MKVTVDNQDACRKKLDIVVEHIEVDAEYKRVLGEYCHFAAIPGFRKGKAPISMVEKRYGRDIIDEVKNRIVPQSFRQAVADEKLKPVSIIHVDEFECKQGNDAVFSIALDVHPDFTLPDYKEVAIDGVKVEITDDQVESMLKNIHQAAAKYVEVTGKAVEEGDICRLDFDGTCDGKPVTEIQGVPDGIGHCSGQWIPADELAILPGFGKQLVGMSVGETRKISVEFQKDSRIAPLSGKTVEYTVVLKELKAKELPALDDQFFTGLGVKSEQELRERLRENAEVNARRQEEMRIRNEIVQKLLKETVMELPQSLVDEETDKSVQDIVYRSVSRGVDRSEITANKESILQAASNSAKDKVKLTYILEAIADKENIAVSDDEVREVILEAGQRENVGKGKLKQALDEENLLAKVRRDLRAENALDFIRSNAKITIK